MNRLVAALMLTTTACDEKHCYTPGHCFSTTYAYDTAPFPDPEPAPPEKTIWELRDVTFEQGGTVTGYFVINHELGRADDWSLCATPPTRTPFQYSRFTSEVVDSAHALEVRVPNDTSGRSLQFDGAFDTPEGEGIWEAIEAGLECSQCLPHQRFEGWAEVVTVRRVPDCPY